VGSNDHVASAPIATPTARLPKSSRKPDVRWMTEESQERVRIASARRKRGSSEAGVRVNGARLNEEGQELRQVKECVGVSGGLFRTTEAT
jgi:hypothetical protein